MKKISLIIPCHNISKTLERCWQSVKMQSLAPDSLECIMVDDASDDNGASREIMQRIEKENPDTVTLVHLPENLRQGGARNVGIAHATGEYLQFLDADDELLPDACSFLSSLADETGADIIQFNHLIVAGETAREARKSKETRLYTIETEENRKPFLAGKHVNYGCWNKFYRMDMVRKSGARFSEHRIYEEPAFVYPQFFYAKKVQLTEELLVRNYIHPEQTMSSIAAKRIMDHPAVQMELLEYCLKHPELMKRYHDEIEYNFLWSFYLETILFARNAGVSLGEEITTHLRKTCLTVFPKGEHNPYIEQLSGEYRSIIEECYSG